MKGKLLRKLGAGLLTCFVLSATFLAQRLPVFAEPLPIAYTAVAVVFAPLWVTQEEGIFKKYNLDVDKLLYIAGGPPSTQALIAGDVQIAFTAAGAVVSANLAGSDVVLIGTTIDLLPFEVWTVPTIKDPSQLKGTKMGVSRLGATSDFVGRYLLKKWGLNPTSDVTIFQTGGMPEVFAALKGGSIQSGVMDTGPFTLQAQKEGLVRLADVSTMGLPYVFGPFAARQSFLRSKPDVVSRFMKAYVEGIHRFKTDKRRALAIRPDDMPENMPATVSNTAKTALLRQVGKRKPLGKSASYRSDSRQSQDCKGCALPTERRVCPAKASRGRRGARAWGRPGRPSRGAGSTRRA